MRDQAVSEHARRVEAAQAELVADVEQLSHAGRELRGRLLHSKALFVVLGGGLLLAAWALRRTRRRRRQVVVTTVTPVRASLATRVLEAMLLQALRHASVYAAHKLLPGGSIAGSLAAPDHRSARESVHTSTPRGTQASLGATRGQ